MELKSIKSGLRTAVRALGYDVRKITGGEPGIDPQLDMRRLTQSRPDLVLFDVGANVGQTIDTFRNGFVRPKIHSFEPGQDAFEILQQNYAAVPDVYLNSFALGAKSGTSEFIESVGSDMSSFLEPSVETKGSIKQRIQVKVTTIDDYCRERDIGHIDILKSDTQGFDLEVLKGATGLLSKNAIHLVYVEINFSDLYKNAARLDEIFGFLASHSLAFVTFYKFHYRDGRADWTDALFVNPNFNQRKTG
jgi:FkbM family methyltransferase